MLHSSKGPLRYSHAKNAGFKLILEVDPDLAYFDRAMIPKHISINPQKYAPHISVVRNEHCVNMEYWGKYEGEQIEFKYSNYIHNGEVYWWINAFSAKLEEIRIELGLPVSSLYTIPPNGYLKCFHITLANSKLLN
jgi:hypothetical protein